MTNPSVLRMDISSPTYRNKLKYLQEELQASLALVPPAIACCIWLRWGHLELPF